MKGEQLVVLSLVVFVVLVFIGCRNNKLSTEHQHLTDLYQRVCQTENLLITTLNNYDAFRDSIPKNIQQWTKNQHQRNGEFNLVIAQLQQRWQSEAKAYNRVALADSGKVLMNVNRIYQAQLPPSVTTEESVNEEDQFSQLLEKVNGPSKAQTNKE